MVPPEEKENDYQISSSSKDKKGEEVVRDQNNNTKSIANMIMGNGKDYSKNRESSIAPGTLVDSQTLVSQTQDRMWRALKRRYQYDSNIKTKSSSK